jgi:hypothetical protein
MDRLCVLHEVDVVLLAGGLVADRGLPDRSKDCVGKGQGEH